MGGGYEQKDPLIKEEATGSMGLALDCTVCLAHLYVSPYQWGAMIDTEAAKAFLRAHGSNCPNRQVAGAGDQKGIERFFTPDKDEVGPTFEEAIGLVPANEQEWVLLDGEESRKIHLVLQALHEKLATLIQKLEELQNGR